MRGYYFITDASLSRAGNISDVQNAVISGVEVVQYRNKTANTHELYKEARLLREICKNTIFIVNDRIDIALGVGADGVHLGQEDMPCSVARNILGKNKTIGVTVSSLEQALRAQESGADYLAVSPIFSTGTKSDAGIPVGVDLIKKIRKIISLPLVAIGGINLENAGQVILAGADAICAISCVVTKPDIGKEIEKIRNLFLKYGKLNPEVV